MEEPKLSLLSNLIVIFDCFKVLSVFDPRLCEQNSCLNVKIFLFPSGIPAQIAITSEGQNQLPVDGCRRRRGQLLCWREAADLSGQGPAEKVKSLKLLPTLIPIGKLNASWTEISHITTVTPPNHPATRPPGHQLAS